ncbi:hypothetical protein CLU79DRAFT_763206 [Phycomyces nitens]|nr:hypothetical protein CLU79DRAFT_763206 [Phycomyces nitens]
MDAPLFVRTSEPDRYEIAAQSIVLVAISIISCLFGVKIFNIKFKYLTLSRWLVLILYIFSWAFTVSTTFLITTNNGNQISCLLSILACDVFYSGTKVMIYAWLIEKVWVVSATKSTRMESWLYKLHLVFLTPYIAIFVLMLKFHTSELQEDGTCIIGLQLIATAPLMVYDVLFNLYMTILFLKPLFTAGKRSAPDWKASRLHSVARRTLVASIICLIVSFANILGLTLSNGRQRGLLCLGCCALDVTISLITVHWVTTSPRRKKSRETMTNMTYPDTGMSLSDTAVESNGAHTTRVEEMSFPAKFAEPKQEELKNTHYMDVMAEEYNQISPSNRFSFSYGKPYEKSESVCSFQEYNESRKSLTKVSSDFSL